MEKCKLADTPIALGTKLSKEDLGSIISSTLYKQLVGSLMYLTTTRLDITYATSFISMFMESPKDSHWKVGKRILIYIAGTTTYCLWYTTSTDNMITCYTDSDYAGSVDDRKSTSRYTFRFGKNLISWASKKQPIVSISSAKEEYVVTTTTTCHFRGAVEFCSHLFTGIFEELLNSIRIYSLEFCSHLFTGMRKNLLLLHET
jgi:hypothetical protein